MSYDSAALARSITRSSSIQSYLITRLLVDRDLADDCLRAYAYFRWADDVIDISTQSTAERIAFIRRQMELVDLLYSHERPNDLTPEEQMLADLIEHDRGQNSGLQSFIRNFIEVLEFDAKRRGNLISQDELTWYSQCLGKAVTNAIQYFIGNHHAYPSTANQYLAATAAHITHMLRDMSEDLNDGFFNISREWLVAHGHDNDIDQGDMNEADFQRWVQGRVKLAREYFREGKRYLDELQNLRCKIAGHWYCARFECVLDTIERDGYMLRGSYHQRSKPASLVKMGWSAVFLACQHVTRQARRRSWETATHSGFETTVTEHSPGGNP